LFFATCPHFVFTDQGSEPNALAENLIVFQRGKTRNNHERAKEAMSAFAHLK